MVQSFRIVLSAFLAPIRGCFQLARLSIAFSIHSYDLDVTDHQFLPLVSSFHTHIFNFCKCTENVQESKPMQVVYGEDVRKPREKNILIICGD